MTATATAAPRRSRKLLVPLVTLLAATGVAFASGANFTSATASAGLVASGTLSQTNSSSVAFSRTNLKPGDVVTGAVTITNTGSLPAWFSITETETSNTFTNPALLNLRIMDGDTEIYNGELGAEKTSQTAAHFLAGASRTFTFTVTLNAAAPNAEQGKEVRTSYAFNSVQSAPTTFTGTQNSTETKSGPADVPDLGIPSNTPLEQPQG